MCAWRCCATRRQASQPTVDPAAALKKNEPPGADDFAAAAVDLPVKKEAAPKPAVTAKPQQQPRGGGEKARSFSEAFREGVMDKAFWDALSSRKPAHCAGAMKGLSKAIDLDSLVVALAHGSANGSTASYKRGELRHPDSFFMAYLDQSTISLTEAERYLPSLLDLCQGLSADFAYVSARLVLDPPGTRSPATVTEGDIAIVQLWGEQQVTAVPPARGMGMTAPRPTPLLSTRLLPGDTIYVPTGLEVLTDKGVTPEREDAEDSSEGPTLCVILTLRTNEHSVASSLGKYLNDVLRTDFSPETDSFFRSAVTKSTLPEGHQGPDGQGSGLSAEEIQKRRETLDAKLKKGAQELAGKLKASAVREHFEQRMEKLRKEQLASAEKYQSPPRVSPIPDAVTTHSFVRISRGVQCKCTPGDSKALFKRGTETLPLPIARTASYMINKLSDGQPHMLETLPCADEVERLCVSQILVFKECMEIVQEDYRSDSAGAYSGAWGSL
eukprot:TRINITY_DN74170_c0_g1_i1.p1 TRINITY_DN74170_c0_g1~~TRINITY_DN74170_c0_g1_i1.p1  ORF type:complete len:498 (+),score=92.85 TRINITY_DN74170_c0_g1_i1:101-1594(+)